MSRLAVALVCLAAGAARAAPVETTTTPSPGVTHVRWTDAACPRPRWGADGKCSVG